MGLVDYSDSEGSDTEISGAPKTAPPATKTAPKPGFQKVIDRSEPRKIKIDLPSVQLDTSRGEDGDASQPPAKRARTAGAFSGFNSLLPAPKKVPAQNGPRAGVSLKTSSEAAFSRAPVATAAGDEEEKGVDGDAVSVQEGIITSELAPEPKMVGNATKFKPLSVANKKKAVKKTRPPEERKTNVDHTSEPSNGPSRTAKLETTQRTPLPKPKRSLFSVQAEEPEAPTGGTTGTYESITTQGDGDIDGPPTCQDPAQYTAPLQPNPNTLSSIASDLNLTPAERRQLFGRNAKNTDINITHFNTDSEYAANEELRQAGEVVEHRAVKSIAPGKHSLQQLVNNARTQQDAMEDKWAEGRRERGEAGGRYGWGGGK